MSDKELEVLAKLLHGIYWEAQGTVAGVPTDWVTINPKIREAWIQVAQYVANQIPPKYGTKEFDNMIEEFRAMKFPDHR